MRNKIIFTLALVTSAILAAGADGFISKNEPPDDLMRIIKRFRDLILENEGKQWQRKQ